MASGEAARLRVRVQPGAAADAVVGWRQDVLAVRVTAPPVDGAANRAVQALLARALGVRPSAVTVLRGAASRDKWLAVEGLSGAEVRRRLGRETPTWTSGCPGGRGVRRRPGSPKPSSPAP